MDKRNGSNGGGEWWKAAGGYRPAGADESVPSRDRAGEVLVVLVALVALAGALALAWALL